TEEEGIGIDDIMIREFSLDLIITDAVGFNDAALGNSEMLNFSVSAGLQTLTQFEISVEVTGPLNYTISRSFSGLNVPHGETQQLQITGLDFSIPGEYTVQVTSITPDLIFANNTTHAIVRNFGMVNEFPYRSEERR